MTNTGFSTRQAPWMKVGTVLDDGVDIETAVKLAGLNFTVSLRDVQFNANPDVDTAPVWADARSRRAVVMDDTNEFVDVVSGDYSVLQYRDAFGFLESVNPVITAAGTLKDRRQAFMVVQLPDMPELLPQGLDDAHQLYTVVRTSHDRSRAVECMVMPLRMKCMNQLGLRSFTAGVTNRWSVHHVGDVASKMHEAVAFVHNVKSYAQDYANTVNRLYTTVLDREDGRKILQHVVRTSAKDNTQRDKTIDTILTLWETRETVGFAGTGWGLINAVSEYLEWDRPTGNRTEQSRFLSAMEGTSRRMLDVAATRILTRH